MNSHSQPPEHNRRGEYPEQGLRLLVVEDHADMCTALRTFFEMLGYRARFATNVASALRAADEETFDVLLSDIGLPDGNGWDLLRQLEVADRRPPHAIAMSGFGLREHAERSKSAGFALHLVKPFSPESLIAALDEAVLVGAPPPQFLAAEHAEHEKQAASLRSVSAGLAV